MGTYTVPRRLGLAVALAATVLGAVAPGAVAAEIIVGAGSKARIHYDVGRAICRHIQRTIQDVTCEAVGIEGRDAAEPIAVLSNVRNGAIEVGLVLSDWQYYAFRGAGPAKFMDVKFDNLRSLFSLHGEPFTVVARRDSGIGSLDDLAGNRVNIGNPGSTQRATMNMVMKAKGWTVKSFQLADELAESEQFLALCHNRVQATVSTVAHPNPAIAKALKVCDARIVEVAGERIDSLIAANSFFASMEVPAGIYKGVDNPVATFGVTLTAVSSEDIDEDQVYAIVKTVFDNLDKFKRLHPVLGALEPGRMVTDGLTAPLHPGAIRYFREQGMM